MKHYKRKACGKVIPVFFTIVMMLAGICCFMGCGDQLPRTKTALTAALRPVGISPTERFLVARRVRARAVEAKLTSNQAAVKRYVTSTDMRCSGITMSAPRGIELDELTYDAMVAIEIAMERGNVTVLTQFARTIERLRWNQGSLTLLVRRLAREELAFAQIIPLDICAMFGDWARSGYRRIPGMAIQFEHERSVLSNRSEMRCRPVVRDGRAICLLGPSTRTVIKRLLKQYGDSEQRKMVRETELIENFIATHTRATLAISASELTRNIGLDQMTLRHFVASLKEP